MVGYSDSSFRKESVAESGCVTLFELIYFVYTRVVVFKLPESCDSEFLQLKIE